MWKSGFGRLRLGKREGAYVSMIPVASKPFHIMNLLAFAAVLVNSS